ncbi:cell division protein FtsQ/DivIB [Jiulongibacter sp. NS-SX5]|uniref:cell division protein FtsQ/DivIB n=1 Tax=Jiulongibacter sp. NS-SX5 TaxID=3463854 RepID=UPI00405843B2
MNIPKSKIKDYSLAFIGLAVVISLIAFVDDKASVRRCKNIDIELIDNNDQYYISTEDIEKHVTRNGNEPLRGMLLADIDLSTLEKRVKEIRQIEHCEAYGDLKGNIHIKAKPYIPYARVISSNGKDQYIDEEGRYFPLSKLHTERVLLLTGSYFNKQPDLTSEDEHLMKLVHTIRNDDFWNAQMAQLDMDRSGNIKFVPVLGDHIIEFGAPTNIEAKLNKLKVYYKQIMPVKGWDKFSTVKIQYKNQVVCE